MIVEAFLGILYNIFQVVFSPINLPHLPENVYTALNSFIDIISDAVDVIGYFLPYPLLIIFGGIIISTTLAYEVWSIVMWIVRKLPFLGMS